MRARHLAVAAVIVLVAVAMQTTLFTSLRPLDATPALGVLVVIAFSRHLREIDALVGGFLTGLLLDLLADSPLGLWALVATSVAFATVRLRDRMEDDFTLIGPAVFVITFGGLALFAVLGTIFGEKTLADAGILRKMLLPSTYNLIIAIVLLPLTTKLIGTGRRRTTGWDP